MPLTIIRKPTPNFRRGRGGRSPIAVVIHIADGLNNLGGTDTHFASPASKVSAHYLVQRNGVIHQYVDESDTAQHAGTVVRPRWPLINTAPNPNTFTIGIEHEGFSGNTLRAAQEAASVQLLREVCARHQIPVDALHIIGHHDIRANKDCPGSGIDVAKLISLAST